MRPSTCLALGACLALVGVAAHQTWPRWTWELRPPAPEVAFVAAVRPFVEQNCLDCHDDAGRKGGFSLENLVAPESLHAQRESWERVLQHVQLDLMPPPEEPRPVPAARAGFIRWLDHALHPLDPDRPDPGRVVVRRLSRAEYANTLRDVLGIDFDPTGDFPEDDTGYGYDHIGDVLNTSPLLFERLLAAARTVSETVITDPTIEPRTWSLQPEHWVGQDARFGAGGYLSSNGAITRTFNAPAEGRYRLTLTLAQDPKPGPEPARAELRLAGTVAGVFAADAPVRRPRRHTLELRLPRGPQTFSLGFINDYYREGAEGRPTEDRNLHFLGLAIEGPFEPSPLPPSDAQLGLLGPAPAPGQPDAAWILASLEKLARPLFRREVAPDELARLAALVARTRAEGGTREAGLQVALQAMLVSPSFLYRGEPASGAPPASSHSPSATAGVSALPLPDAALATRLGYFLWAGPPDTRLLDLARDGRLRDELPAEVDRLLADPRSRRFLQNFAGQWLLARNLRLRSPDPALFPDWTPDLAASLEQEILRFVGDFLTNGRPVTELLSSGETFMDARLAALYGAPRPDDLAPAVFVRTALPEGRRAGLLGLPGILAVSSYPNRTSPVLRGKFILEQILGTPPPSPPPNIPSLSEDAHAGGVAQTLRERLEQHRAAPSCAACHAHIDPLGFALEGFAADGRARTTENGLPIDTAGRLETGEPVENPEQLAAALLATRADVFRRQLATQLLVFALGRGTDYYDRPALDRIVAEARAAGDTLPAYLHAVTRSFPFLNQRPPDAPAPTPPDASKPPVLARL
jgi:hypothetical protein